MLLIRPTVAIAQGDDPQTLVAKPAVPATQAVPHGRRVGVGTGENIAGFYSGQCGGTVAQQRFFGHGFFLLI